MGNDPSLDCNQHGEKATKCKFVKQVYLIDAQCGTHINGPSPQFDAIYDEVMVCKKQDRFDRHMVDYLDACNHVLRYHHLDVSGAYCNALLSPVQCALQNCRMLQRHYSHDKFRETSVLHYVDDDETRDHDLNQMLFFQAIDSFHEFLHHNRADDAVLKRALIQKWNRHYYSSLAIRFVGLHNHRAQSELELKKKSKLHAHPSKGDLSHWGAATTRTGTHTPQLTHGSAAALHKLLARGERLQSVDAYDSDSTAHQSNTFNTANLKLGALTPTTATTTTTINNNASGSDSGGSGSTPPGKYGGSGSGGAYDTLRSEILHECALSKLAWDALMTRASQLTLTAELKRIRHKHDNNLTLSVSHVAVLCLYSSYDVFQQKLCELSRLKKKVSLQSKKEHAKLAKKLHARLGHSFKLLADAVQNYGYEAPAEYGVQHVYRGLTSLPLLRKYLLACTVPTSTSMCAAAAATFAGQHGNGCVLQLSVPANSRFLPLQFVSLYRTEREVLFYGKYSFLCIEKLLCQRAMTAPPSFSKSLNQAAAAAVTATATATMNIKQTAIDLNALVLLEKLTSRYSQHVYHCMEEDTYGAVLSRLLRQHQSRWLRTNQRHRCSMSRSRSESRSLCYIKYRRRKSLSQQSMHKNSLKDLNELLMDQYADEFISLDESAAVTPLPMMTATATATATAMACDAMTMQAVHTQTQAQVHWQSTVSGALAVDSQPQLHNNTALQPQLEFEEDEGADEEEEEEYEYSLDDDAECKLDDISLHAEFDHYIAKKRILWLDNCELMRLIHGEAASFDEYHLDITKLVDIFYAVRYVKIADSYRVNMNDIINYCKADVHSNHCKTEQTATAMTMKKTTKATKATTTPATSSTWREPKLRQIELYHGYDIEYINKILGIWPNECRWEVFFDLDSVTFKRDVVSQTAIDDDADEHDADDCDQF